MKTTVLAIRAVLFLSVTAGAITVSSARAQYRGSSGAPLSVSAWGSHARGASPTSKPQLVSESTAKSLSLWSTVIPTTAGMLVGNKNHVAGGTLVVAGLIVGPSIGYFYGHCPGRGAQGLLIRAVTLGATVALTVRTAENTDTGDFGTNIANAELAIAIGGVGACALIYEAIHDIGHVRSEVERRNSRIVTASFSLGPRYFAQNKAFGLQLRAAL